MAEVVSSAIGLLYPLIHAEVSLIYGLRGEVAAIHDELSSIKILLKNAEERADEDDSVKEWVRQVRMLAHEIEDVIEEYNLLSKGNEFFGKVKKIVPLNKRTIAKTIESLRKKAVDIGQRKTNYRFDSVIQQAGHFCNFEGSTHQSTILSVGMIEESELVGAETAKEDLIGLLGLQEFEDSRISTIAVTGMRGLGKTTVVGSVYNDELVRDYFPIRAWVPVSRPYNHVGILRSMLKQFYESPSEIEQFGESSYDSDASNSTIYPILEGINSMEERSLLCRLKKFLSEKRYLVVFDDVQDEELATYVKMALPFYDNKASKILITTRYENVARTWAEGSNQGLYKLKPLPSVEAWKLFCKRAFRNNQGNSYPFLDGRAQEIVKRCQGMPLIISEMGRFLSTKLDNLEVWKKKSESPGFCLRQDHPGIYKHLIRSSYHDLPHYLKPCLLYFGLFPEGCLIGQARIIRLWIAEGFIIVEGGNGVSANLTPEELAEKYIKQLVDMNLVKECTDATGRSKNLQVPIILHEIILSKITELGFCQTLSEKNNSTSTEEFVKPRRLSIHMDHSFHDADHQVIQNITKTKSSIRSLLYAKMYVQPAVSTNLFSKNFLLLKVLDFSNALIYNLPNEVGELLNLHYLCLRNTQVSRLPSSLGKLEYLQTLDLKHTLISELPSDLNKLRKLRHLLTYSYKYDPAYSLHTQKLTGVKLPEKALEKCGELQKLAFVDVGHRSMVVKELRNLRQLRRLGITELKFEDGKDLCAAIEEMQCLQTFSVYSKNLSEFIDLDHFQSPQLALKCLYLNGPLKSCCTGWILELHSLVKIRLRWSRLEVDPLPLLETLPNLVELQMLEAYNGDNLIFVNGGFKKLKILHLLDLRNLKSLSICKGALPLLQLMAIGESPKLQVPLGIKHLSKLETLNLFNMPLDFADSLHRNRKYHFIVKHVPNVLLQKRDDQGNWQTFSLQ
ncbi:disease resistance protein RPM1-like [Chenopodium quinoa]|uniref:Uncharacterized protein n=1 Tax=Chenopodium quinoa TaxID=63459 RepID=A0A803LQC5_CHEQI|nr:disease resistance protein RPM1-like [Chenopodium quinoa]XP_021740779.1 disease resistance protein RPM1-like [Chenopodium quinoa]